ncbi:MAG: CheB methylesterase domain-containing protein [Vallitaleaceae bacterium]|jgi:two-component system chemotaxis response regulator CheB|nr:CheB methylesterase domain-containing protein [Vallitaleaceae bacterium]
MYTPNKLELSNSKNPYGRLFINTLNDITQELEDYYCNETVIAIGASTGGIKAIETILEKLPDNMPPIVIVQHLPKRHTDSLARRLDIISALHVSEAKHNDQLLSGHVYIAPGDQHMTIKKIKGKLHIQLDDGPLVCYQKPSVEVLFNSMAAVVKDKGFGIILTGMGSDGANGLKNMKDCGAHTVAQDEATSIVFGMPRRAIELGAAPITLPIHNISRNIVDKLRDNRLGLAQ